MSGVFSTDSLHYTYIIDQQCGDSQNVLDIGRAFGNPEYDALTKKWRRQCLKRGQKGICVFETAVVISGVVRRSDRILVIDVDHIVEKSL